MRKVVLYSFLLIMAINFISAQQTLGTFKQNECIDLLQTCADCSYINFTKVTYPDSSLALGSVQADKDGSVFNYEFCNTTQLGNYKVWGIGDVGGDDTVFAYDFDITPDGRQRDLKDIIFYLFFFFLCLILLVYSGKIIKENPPSQDATLNLQMYKLKQKSDLRFYLKILKSKLYIAGCFGIYLSLLIFISLLFQISSALGFAELVSFLNPLTIILSWGLIPFVLFWGGYLIITFIKSTKDILIYQFGGLGERIK